MLGSRFRGLLRGGDFYFLPGRRTPRPRTRPLPQPGAQRIPADTFQTRFRARPYPVTRPSRGMLSGNRGWGPQTTSGLGTRGRPWGSVRQGGLGPLELLRTWERPGPGRPLGADGDLALGPWRRGRPGLAQRRWLQEARGFGLRRRLVPRPLSRPRSVRETAALRPAPSAAQAPAPAPTSTWGPIETVRHAPPPPPPPPGAAAAALAIGRGGGKAPRVGCSRRASLGPHGGGGRRARLGGLAARLLGASG